jgi:toxin ParE1/3/4
MTLQHHPEARIEILKIVEWYFAQEKSLAAEFDTELRQAERNIVDFPDFWHLLDGGYRRYHMKRFPYSVVYRVEDEVLLIVSVAGHKQPQNYWRKRL